MAIEAGARVGLIGVDNKTISYLKGRKFAPKADMWEEAKKFWMTLKSDPGAVFEKKITFKANEVKPMVTWGTSPEMVVDIDSKIPENDKSSINNALNYMGLESGKQIKDVFLDKIFIGSCTNSRIEDLRSAAIVVKGKKVSKRIIQAMVVPGSGPVKRQAEEEGLDKIFLEAGFEWREPGCSMCLAMNADRLSPKERCASTSNRNFEGRQGNGGRTHLVSPAMAAAAAISGHFVDVTKWKLDQ